MDIWKHAFLVKFPGKHLCQILLCLMQIQFTQPVITCSKLTIKIPERRHDVVLVSLLITLKHISHVVLVFILNIVHITLNVQLSAAYILCLGDSFRTRTPIFLRKVNLWNTWNALCKIELTKKFKNFKSNSHYLFKVNYRNIRKRWQIC